MNPVIPRAAVSACIFREGMVLLVQRGKPPYAGRWSLPGGSVEPGERAAEAAAREVAEETGIAATLHRVTGVNDVILRDEAGTLTHHFVITVFTGTGTGEPKAASDAMDARFVPLDQVETFAVGRRLAAIIRTAWASGNEAPGTSNCVG